MLGTLNAVETSFRLHSSGQTILPHKPVLRWGDEASEEMTGRIIAMPAYLGGDLQISGIKWIPSKPDNPTKRGLPRANAIIILNDPESLMPVAIMDGTLVSAMRTGAASGVAAKYLALPDSEVLGMVGAGVQMRTQIMAMKEVLPGLKYGRIYNRSRDKANRFAEEMSRELGFEIVPVESAEVACKDADIFITATTSSFPYVRVEWYKPGALHCEISYWDTYVETLAKLDHIYCDDYNQVAYHGGVAYRAVRDGLIHREQVNDLGDMIVGKVLGRTRTKDRIIFNPIGMGTHDISEAYRVYKNACEKGVGRTLSLWEKPHWW